MVSAVMLLVGYSYAVAMILWRRLAYWIARVKRDASDIVSPIVPARSASPVLSFGGVLLRWRIFRMYRI